MTRSAEKGEPSEYRIPPEDIHRAFEGMGANKPCPICGHEHWKLLHGEDDYPSIVLLGGDQMLSSPPLHIAITMLFCGNCLFLRSHPTKGLIQWLEQNPKEEPPPPEE